MLGTKNKKDSYYILHSLKLDERKMNMDLILIFVVLPLATIIFSIALQRLLKCPILVATIIFAIFLILTYTVFGTDFIIFAILFAILAFITAFLVVL